MEANVNKTPIFATVFFTVIVLFVGFIMNIMMIPSGAELTDDIFWLYSVPTLFIMSGSIIFAVFGEKNKLAEMCGVGAIMLSFIMMVCGSSYAIIIFAGGTIGWLMVFFRFNPICQKQLQKWFRGIISEETPEKA